MLEVQETTMIFVTPSREDPPGSYTDRNDDSRILRGSI